MPYPSVDQENVRQIEKTKRARLIYGTVTSSPFAGNKISAALHELDRMLERESSLKK